MSDLAPVFWKLSQGSNEFSFADMLSSIDEKLVYMNIKTGAKGGSRQTQAEHFVKAKIGDYFYLTHGNQGIYLLGQFIGSVNYLSKFGGGWLDRPFRVIRFATHQMPYDGEEKWWTPNHNSTFVKVPTNELGLFESNILQPYFDIGLEDFGL